MTKVYICVLNLSIYSMAYFVRLNIPAITGCEPCCRRWIRSHDSGKITPGVPVHAARNMAFSNQQLSIVKFRSVST